MTAATEYVRSGDAYLAYQVVGDGAVDIVIVAELLSQVDHRWEEPKLARSLRRLASFGRLIQFDRRGTGLSDRVPVDRLPTLEQRMQDLLAVLDAVGSATPVVVGFGEGGVESILFAASHPARVSSLVLYGAWPRFYADEEYPHGWHRDSLAPLIDGIVASWGKGLLVDYVAPTMAGDERFRRWIAQFERLAASPGTAGALMRIGLGVDVRSVLPAVRVPTLILHRTDDHFSPVGHGRYLAEAIPGARFVELPAVDHPFFAGDADAVIDEIEDFVTGTRPVYQAERILATVLFVDIVGSTERAVAVGDREWRDAGGVPRDGAAPARPVQRARDRHGRRRRVRVIRRSGAGDVVRSGHRDAAAALGLEVRAGVHIGECEVIAGKIGGVTVHVAARVAGRAEPSEVLVSRTIRDLVAGSSLRFEDRGTHTLKGLPEEWALVRALTD